MTTNSSNEEHRKTIETRVAVSAIVISLAGLIISTTFNGCEVRRQSDAVLRESQRPFYEQQLNLYMDASETVSKIANYPPGKERMEAYDHFWSLHWGPLYLVEAKAINEKMTEIGKFLMNHELRKETRLASPEQTQLQMMSLDLARILRSEIKKSWQSGRPLVIVDEYDQSPSSQPVSK